MDKCILMSIKPKYVSMILNKTKTLEVRKRFPKNYRGWVYIYCTKDKLKDYYYDKDIFGCYFRVNLDDNLGYEYSKNLKPLNGKVIARFYCNNVEEIENRYCKGMLIDSCLTNWELNNYLGNKQGYAINISQLEIFDTPKELSEFIQSKRKSWEEQNVKRPPQSWLYIEVEK